MSNGPFLQESLPYPVLDRYDLQLSDGAKLRKGELSRKWNDVAWFLPRDWLWPPQSKQPLSLGELPEVELRTAKMRLQTASILYLGDRGTIRRKAN